MSYFSTHPDYNQNPSFGASNEFKFKHSKKSTKQRKSTVGDVSTPHSFFTQLNYTNVNLTINLGKKFELEKISMSLCKVPNEIHVSLFKSSNDGKTLSPLHHFSNACASIMAREATSKHPVKALRVKCSPWPSQLKCAKERFKKRSRFEKNEYKRMNYYNSNYVKHQNYKYLNDNLNVTNLKFDLINDIPFKFDAKRGYKSITGLNNCTSEGGVIERGRMCFHKCCRVHDVSEKVCQKMCSKYNKKYEKEHFEMLSRSHPSASFKLHKNVYKRKNLNFKNRPENSTKHTPKSNNLHRRNTYMNKYSIKCNNIKVTFDLEKSHKMEDSPLMRDWVTANEVIVSIYYPEHLDQIYSALSSSLSAETPASSLSSSSSSSTTSLSNSKTFENVTFLTFNEETLYQRDIKEIAKIK